MARLYAQKPLSTPTKRTTSTSNPLKSLAQNGTFGFIPQLAASLVDELDKVIPGGTQAGVERVKTKLRKDPLSFTPLAMREQVVPAARVVGKAIKQEQPLEDIGYGLRGALSITPFQRRGEALDVSTPTTPRQQTAERVGRAAYGTAMTLPIGGVAAIPGRVAAGAALGAGIRTVPTVAGKVLTEGKLPTLAETGESVKAGALTGIENSWVLAFTGLGLDKALGAAATKIPAFGKFISSQAGLPFRTLQTAAPEVKGKLFAEGAKRLMGRALLETLPENTAFTFLDKLSGKEGRSFVKAWTENLPGTLLGNVAFAGAQIAKGAAFDWNKQDIDAAVNAFNKAVEKTGIQPGFTTKAIGPDQAKKIQDDLMKQYDQALNAGDEAKQADLAKQIQKYTSTTRFPPHQVELEQAKDAGDWQKVGKILNAIPADDPYKEPMERLFRSRVVEMTQNEPTVKMLSNRLKAGATTIQELQAQGYKGDMLETIQKRAGISTTQNLEALRKAQQVGDTEAERTITDKIRAEAIPEKPVVDMLANQVKNGVKTLDQLKAEGVDTHTLAYVREALGQGKTFPIGMQAKPIGGPESITEAQAIAEASVGPQTPVQKIITALKGAEQVRGKQEALYSEVKSRQTPVLASVQAEMGGEAGVQKMMGTLKGELPKAEFTGVRNQLTQTDVDSLFNEINASGKISTWDKVPAIKGLGKLLQPEGGIVPTEGEIRLLNEVFGPEFTKAVMDNRPRMKVYMDQAAEVLNVPRALMASIDMSAPLRQGWLLWPRRLLTQPKQALGEIGDMIKMFGSENAYKASYEEIDARPTKQLMDDAGLQITKIDDPSLTGREEIFMSNLAERIPGIGRIVRASDRAYTGFLNQLRADTFDGLLKQAEEQKLDLTPARLGSIAKFVNSASGRGDLGKFAQHATLLNSVFFSPRLMASRLNALNPTYYASLDPLVRKEAVKSLVTSTGTAMTILGLSALAGAKVTTDPRNADFGKIRIGNTRIDVTGGFGPYIRLIAQFLSGKIISSTTGKEIVLNEDTYKPITRMDVLTRFIQTKESPILSFATGLMTGKDGIGEKFQVGPEIIEGFMPLFLQDVFETMREQGVLAGAAMSVPAFFGAGVQTYGKKIPEKGFTETGRPNVQYREPPGLGEEFLNKITGKQSDFTPERASQLWSKEEQKRIKQADKDKVGSIQAKIRKGEISRAEGQRQINQLKTGQTNSLQELLPFLFSQGAPATGAVAPTRGGRLYGGQ